MAKKIVKKSAKKAVKKSAKKVVKKSQKKIAKKSAKKSAKKPVKKVAKKVAKKKIVKKAIKKAAKKVVAKKPIKKTAKKVIKKAAVKKAAPKKAAPKKAVKKTAVKKQVTNKAVTKPVALAPKVNLHSTHLTVGDKAPFFEGVDQNGNAISSYSMAGKTVVLYFYPKDDTPGCTAEACSLRDEYYFLGSNNYAVVGVSADDAESHKKFAEKYSLPFPLIADTNMDIIKAFDVWGTKQLAGRIYDGIVRTTFVIGADGIIKHVIKDVDTKEHAKQILAL